MTEDVAKETSNDAEKGDVVETDKTSVVNGDVGDCPVGEQLHLVNCCQLIIKITSSLSMSYKLLIT